MKFIDDVRIYVKAGNGGRGCVSFRREKYVPRGGPDGGDGGKGGDVILRGNKDLISLVDFKYKKIYKAENGKPGSGKGKKGRDGRDLFIPIPLGTVVYKGEDIICEVIEHDESYIVAKGGRGGRGNGSFATPTNRAPRQFEYGEKGEEKHLRLVLKLISDFGIIGLPNTGKSTLLRKLTEAKSRSGDWPFTTLTPKLGTLKFEDERLVIADIPGIIEGASKGKGLGLDFLKHIERSRMLIWTLDLSSRSPNSQYQLLESELSFYNGELLKKKRILVLNKIDLVSPQEAEKWLEYFKKIEKDVLLLSALWGTGIDELKDLLKKKAGE